MFRNRHLDLSRVPLEALLAELGRRGLTARNTGEWVDGTKLWDELSEIANKRFPEAVELVKDLRGENRELRRRALSAERQTAMFMAFRLDDERGDIHGC